MVGCLSGGGSCIEAEGRLSILIHSSVETRTTAEPGREDASGAKGSQLQ